MKEIKPHTAVLKWYLLFVTGFLAPFLYIASITMIYDDLIWPSFVHWIWVGIIWPGTLVYLLGAGGAWWGWSALAALFVGIFWGLIFMAIGWGWDELKRRKKS